MQHSLPPSKEVVESNLRKLTKESYTISSEGVEDRSSGPFLFLKHHAPSFSNDKEPNDGNTPEAADVEAVPCLVDVSLHMLKEEETVKEVTQLPGYQLTMITDGRFRYTIVPNRKFSAVDLQRMLAEIAIIFDRLSPSRSILQLLGVIASMHWIPYGGHDKSDVGQFIAFAKKASNCELTANDAIQHPFLFTYPKVIPYLLRNQLEVKEIRESVRCAWTATKSLMPSKDHLFAYNERWLREHVQANHLQEYLVWLYGFKDQWISNISYLEKDIKRTMNEVDRDADGDLDCARREQSYLKCKLIHYLLNGYMEALQGLEGMEVGMRNLLNNSSDLNVTSNSESSDCSSSEHELSLDTSIDEVETDDQFLGYIYARHNGSIQTNLRIFNFLESFL